MFLSSYLNEDKLTKGLEFAFDDLQNQGFLAGADKESLISAVVENIKSENGGSVPDFNMSDANKTALTSWFQTALIEEHDSDPKSKLNYPRLLMDIPKFTPDEKKQLKDELGDYLKEKLTLLNKQSANPQPQDEINKTANAFANAFVDRHQALAKEGFAMTFFSLLAQLTRKSPQPGKKKESSEEEKTEKDEMSPDEVALRNLFGGVDPRKSSSSITTVEYVQGNPEGFINTGISIGKSFMDELNQYNPEFSDYNGEELETLFRLANIGAATNVLEDKLMSNGVIPKTGPQLTPGS